jgi:hypothetical protein
VFPQKPDAVTRGLSVVAGVDRNGFAVAVRVDLRVDVIAFFEAPESRNANTVVLY